jgi:hypothetical protein
LYQEDTRIDVESISSPITTQRTTKILLTNVKGIKENKENLNGYLLKKQRNKRKL